MLFYHFLLFYDERIHDEEEEKHDEQNQDKLMYADSQSQQERYDSGRGGRYGYRGRGRGRFGYQQNGYYRQERDASKVECYRCDKIGHFAQNCPTTSTNNQTNKKKLEYNT